MKIGILTFHRAINYGAVLQCYALYKTLSDMGHDVEVIDYRPDSIEKYRKYFRKQRYAPSINIKKKINNFISDTLLLSSRRKTGKRFDKFLSRNLNFSNIANQINGFPQYYDVVFWGSDQIWNPRICEGMDRVLWGQVDLPNTIKSTYAASIGRIECLSPNQIRTIGTYIRTFDSISVREESLQKFINEKYGIPAYHVSDPSLLLTAEKYIPLIHKPVEYSYILLYLLEENEHAEKMAKSFANQLGCNVIRLFGMKNPLKRIPMEYKSEISPSDFLSYIRHARCVITNSFHATSYSVLFNVDFYYVKRKNNNDRALSLLEKICLSSRVMDKDITTIFSPIDFTIPNREVESFRMTSKEYLKFVLQKELKDHE